MTIDLVLDLPHGPLRGSLIPRAGLADHPEMPPLQSDPSLPLALGGEISTGRHAIRLAQGRAEIDACQALRYRVFYDEMQARPTAEMAARARDFDAFDDVADHLMVLDYERGRGAAAVVGTYRLIRREAAAVIGHFYTADEFDIAPVVGFPGPVLELGRSCVEAPYRTRPIMQLLWRGIAAYVFHYDIRLMFGCASLHGTEVGQLALPLSYLWHHHLAPPALRPLALPHRRVEMNMLPAEDLDLRAAMSALPPLIKGYLRLGGFVGDGAVIDHQFNTTDVCVIVKTELVTDKYYRHYERTARASGE